MSIMSKRAIQSKKKYWKFSKMFLSSQKLTIQNMYVFIYFIYIYDYVDALVIDAIWKTSFYSFQWMENGISKRNRI